MCCGSAECSLQKVSEHLAVVVAGAASDQGHMAGEVKKLLKRPGHDVLLEKSESVVGHIGTGRVAGADHLQPGADFGEFVAEQVVGSSAAADMRRRVIHRAQCHIEPDPKSARSSSRWVSGRHRRFPWAYA